MTIEKKFKIGEKVKIVRAIPDETGQYDGNYSYGGTIRQVPIGTIAEISDKRQDGGYTLVLDDNGHWSVKPQEIELCFNKNSNPFKFPLDEFLSKNTPLFLLNDKVYLAGYKLLTHKKQNKEELDKLDKYIVREGRRKISSSVIKTVSLASIEKLMYFDCKDEITKYAQDYIEEIKENFVQKKATYTKTQEVIIDFIVNKVFPYLKNDSSSDKRVLSLLKQPGEEEAIELPKTSLDSLLAKIEASQSTNLIAGKNASEDELIEKEIRANPRVQELVSQIKNEPPTSRKESSSIRSKKLDALLSQNRPQYMLDFSNDYEPKSILGKFFGGRNVAIIDGQVYNMIARLSDYTAQKSLKFNEVNYELISSSPVEETVKKFNDDLIKELQLNAIRSKVLNDALAHESKLQNNPLKELITKDRFEDGELGFSKYSSTAYWVSLKVPEHALKLPDNYFRSYNPSECREYFGFTDTNHYFKFDSVKVRVLVSHSSSGDITYDSGVYLDREYSHPFRLNDNKICMGSYNYSKLSADPAKAVAKLLKDARQVLLSGYLSGHTGPVVSLHKFKNREVTLAELTAQNIPVTNINLSKPGDERQAMYASERQE